MRVKICGITRREDAELCEELGADFLGFVFVKSSPRFVQEIPVKSPHHKCKRVGVFRDHSLDDIHRIAEVAQLDIIQLHGNESEDFVRAIQLPVIKAVHVQDALPDTNTSADWILFDTGGGTGRRFDWSLLADYPRTKPFFLAGGITPDNVEAAIRRARPDAIDLSSGVESAPGIKDHRKLRELFERVQRT
ncbi:MAG TPA: phosphoribosylanthranilate isomerase [Thermoanaerobaculia bacterium]|nr:phosphoribosylanthranilate isomerase [Thermoanaerobaculia bacterium]